MLGLATLLVYIKVGELEYFQELEGRLWRAANTLGR